MNEGGGGAATTGRATLETRWTPSRVRITLSRGRAGDVCHAHGDVDERAHGRWRRETGTRHGAARLRSRLRIRRRRRARASRAFDEETRVARSSASSIAHCFSTNARRTARFSSSRLVSARASSRADSRSAARRRRAAAAPSPRARNPGHVSVSSFTHVNVTVVPSIAIVVLPGSTSAYKSHRHANGVAVAARLDLVPGARANA